MVYDRRFACVPGGRKYKLGLVGGAGVDIPGSLACKRVRQ